MKEREREREEKSTVGWLSRRQNISLVPYDGAGSSGVWVGVDLIFINISRVAHAQRAASLPTHPRGPYVQRQRERQRREKREEGKGMEKMGNRGEMREERKSVRLCVHACMLLMSVCIGYECVVVCGERESTKKGEREGGA